MMTDAFFRVYRTPVLVLGSYNQNWNDNFLHELTRSITDLPEGGNPTDLLKWNA
jgi:hypothetical protein